jgi:putative SOS response-associated peptidase YedK
MCGRFANYFEPVDEAVEFGASAIIDPPPPSWNIPPTSTISIVRDRASHTAEGSQAEAPVARELRGARWGLVPSWSARPTGSALVNARAESVTTKPSFRAAAARRRALIPAAGYYEWQAAATGPKTPFYLHPADQGMIALAGLYEWWWPPAATENGPVEPLLSAVIITRAATDTLGTIHDRMPLVLPPELWAAWLDPSQTALTYVRDLIESVPDPALRPRQVGRAVGSVRNNGPALIEPV